MKNINCIFKTVEEKCLNTTSHKHQHQRWCYQGKSCNQDCVSPAGHHTSQCYLFPWTSRCSRVTTTRDDTQGWGFKRLKGKTPAHAHTQRAAPTNTPAVGAQIAPMHVVQQPLSGPCRSKTAALKCFRVTEQQNEDLWSGRNEHCWQSMRQWLERSTRLLFSVYLSVTPWPWWQFAGCHTLNYCIYSWKKIVKHTLLTNVHGEFRGL